MGFLGVDSDICSLLCLGSLYFSQIFGCLKFERGYDNETPREKEKEKKEKQTQQKQYQCQPTQQVQQL